jgi:hypothetical protein
MKLKGRLFRERKGNSRKGRGNKWEYCKVGYDQNR